MPRKYSRELGSRSYRNYKEETLEEAVSKIKSGVLTLCKASLQYNIAKGTLHNRVKGVKRKFGGQTVFSEEEEKILCETIIKVSSWGFPLSTYDLRCLAKSYLDKKGVRIARFVNNLPGVDWTMSFLKRNDQCLIQRKCQNIIPQRAQITVETMNLYFDNLTESLRNVPPSNIFNYDETNVTDDPGAKKFIFKRGVKYPERIMSHSKTSVSLMFCGSAAGVLLPIYTVYKSENLWTTWAEGGPPGARFNRTTHGWFDAATFFDWFQKTFITYARTLEGVKVIIGDNLASHFTHNVIQLAEENNVHFVYLPPNATHLAQPLDVAVFGPLKKIWRRILTTWKDEQFGVRCGLPKAEFPKLLKQLWDKCHENDAINNNLKAGFKATGIFPLNRNEVLKKIVSDQAHSSGSTTEEVMSDTVVEFLKIVRFGVQKEKSVKRRKKISVEPGKSISVQDLEGEAGTSGVQMILRKESQEKKKKKTNKKQNNTESEDEAEIYLDDSSDEDLIMDIRNSKKEEEEMTELDRSCKIGDFILVRFSTKRSVKHFVGQILDILNTSDDGDYLVKFLKHEDGGKFKWPLLQDKSVIPSDDIVKKLPQPQLDRRECLNFFISFDGYNLG